MIVNLTPHPLHIYAANTPDRIDPTEHQPIRVIEPSGQVARMGVVEYDAFVLDGLTVARLEHTGATGLPPVAGVDVWYVVPLVVALDAPHRPDLLVVHLAVRDLNGHVIGCRCLGRPSFRTTPKARP